MPSKSISPGRKSRPGPNLSAAPKPERRQAGGPETPQMTPALDIDYQALFNVLGDAVLVLEADTGRILEANRRMGEMFGYTPEEVQGLSLLDLFQMEHGSLETARRALSKAVRGEPQSFHGAARDSAGLPFWLETHLQPAVLTGQELVLAVMRDITGRKEMTQALTENEARFRTVIESSLAGVYIIQDGTFVYVNPRLAQFFGYRPEEIVGRLTPEDLVHPDDRPLVTENIRLRLSGELDSVNYTWRGLCQDGAIIDVEVLGRRVDFLGRPAVIGTVLDITQRRRAEEQLHRRDAILEAVAAAGEKLLASAAWEENIQEILGLLGRAAGATSVHLFEKPWEPEGAPAPRERYAWTAPNFTVKAADPDSRRLTLAPRGSGAWGDFLAPRDVIFGREQDFLESLQEHPAFSHCPSVLAVPVFMGNQLWGALCFQDCEQERQWTSPETVNLRTAANTLGAVMQRQAMEEALRASEAGYREVFDGVTEGIAVQDLATLKLLDVNRKWCEMTGFTRKEALNLQFGDTFLDAPPYTLKEAHGWVEKISREGPQAFEWRSRDRQGQIHEVEVILKCTVIGNRDCLLAVARDVTARNQRDAALRESQERFRQLAENIKDIFWLISFEGDLSQLLYINPAYEEIWGRPISGLMADPMDWVQAVHPEDRSRLAEINRRFLQGEFQDQEYRIIRPDGEVRWINSRAFPVYDEQGNLSRVAGLGVDITERKLAEEALRESELRFRQLAENIREVFWMTNADGRETIYVSPAYEEVWGRALTDQARNPLDWLAAVHPEDLSRVIEARQEMADGIRLFHEEYRIVRPDGQVRWIHDRAFAVRDRAGAVYRLGGLAEDITEEKLAAEAMRESEERHRSLINDVLDSSAVGIFILDPHCRIVWVNRALEEFFNLKREDIIGQDQRRLIQERLQYLVKEPDAFARRVLAACEGRAHMDKFECHVLPDHHRPPRWLEYWSQPIATGLYAGGLIEHYRDITARKEAEARLQDSEKQLRFLTSQLLNAQESERRRISRELHDELGQSLTLLKMHLVAMEEKLPASPNGLRADCEYLLSYIDQIIENVRRLSWDLSPTILEDLGLSSSLRHLLHETCKNHEIIYAKKIDDLDGLFSPALQIIIYRIFQEALTNICKHAQATRVTVDLKRQSKRLTFTVKDNGVGFDLDEALSRNGPERGLGLTAIQERVLLAGGAIHLWSRKGGGTRITFTLPMDRKG